jgi:hypothetical protein
MSVFDRIEQYGFVHLIAIDPASVDRVAEMRSAQ